MLSCFTFSDAHCLLKTVITFSSGLGYFQVFKLDRFGRLMLRSSMLCVDADGAYVGSWLVLLDCHSLRSGFWELEYGQTHSQVVHRQTGLCWVPALHDSGSSDELRRLKLRHCVDTDSPEPDATWWTIYPAHLEGTMCALLLQTEAFLLLQCGS